MAKTYTSDQAQNAEEGVAKKADGRAIPAAYLILIALIAVTLAAVAFSRYRGAQPQTAPDAIQSAPTAAPGDAPRSTSGS